MKSFCIKTNNEIILDYLLERIKKIDFEDLIYSKNKFKTYKNIIIHFKGADEHQYNIFLKELIQDVILKFYEEKIIKRTILFNYFYFEESEREQIYNCCIEIMREDEFKIKEKNKTYENKENILNKEISRYLCEADAMLLEGFVTFRLKKYFSYLDNIIDIAVNKYIVEKEYREFIELLRTYVDNSISKKDLVHLIYKNNEAILLDNNKNLIDVSTNLLKNKVLSDISFSTNDYVLNTLLSIIPKKIEIHIIDVEDEFIDTIKGIFRNKVSICKDCNICKTYKMLNNVKIRK